MQKLPAIILLILLLLGSTTARAQPVDALDVSSAELRRGQSFDVIAVLYRDSPALVIASLELPPGLGQTRVQVVGVDGQHGTLIRWRLTVAEDAPLSRAPVPIGLVVDGQRAGAVSVRIWTDAEIRQIFLPMVEK